MTPWPQVAVPWGRGSSVPTSLAISREVRNVSLYVNSLDYLTLDPAGHMGFDVGSPVRQTPCSMKGVPSSVLPALGEENKGNPGPLGGHGRMGRGGCSQGLSHLPKGTWGQHWTLFDRQTRGQRRARLGAHSRADW